ncbi:efflux transporter outer membrane subunit [Asticcacaulis tiandongensis]|uniref:efflux transporter outer membrane subunit n=1 Tax=Asticcacaulis tiandongensis TaxID=2565365 RepID=UPI00112E93EF|nr:efflux transporter outer membrane subunit [Asticcacaulis tiandongensis]
MTSLVKLTLMGAASAVVLSACSLAPHYERGVLPTSQAWPVATEISAQSADSLGWREVFLDPRLQKTIELALDYNRDLRVAVLNVEQARAQYRIQRSALVPNLDGTISATKTEAPVPAANGVDGEIDFAKSENFSANFGVTAYELDLFGRVRSLNQAALNDFFSREENRKAVQISIVAATAQAWLGLAADQELLSLSRQTLQTREEGLSLTQRRFDVGAASQLELSQQTILAEQARNDVATYEALVQQDLNALRLLVGTELPINIIPRAFPENAILSAIPVGVPSEVLLNRPDVMAAEYNLKGRNANIGAARAAFFPSISLTGSAGYSSTDFDQLFDGGSTWTFRPSINIPIFDAGARIAGAQSAVAGRDIALAQYERSIQTAFREVSDALAVRSTIDRRLAAQTSVLGAAQSTVDLSQARFDAGIDSYLSLYDAQRTYYTAQQGLINTRLLREINLVSLYSALGGGFDAAE